ncbi:hypothetical protein T12_14084 [Trichinella patagoniensis]|uniref:Uncharacterized protein n=1 Tax=Trichinella patagoniensis TaxID=990121 RepID=A0A0V0ZJ65_9BILA|nr:hypothetical protein T12_14084 [Trichinella patagoniensis]
MPTVDCDKPNCSQLEAFFVPSFNALMIETFSFTDNYFLLAGLRTHKIVIRRVGNECYITQSGTPVEDCFQSPVVETETEESEDDVMQCKFSKMLTKLINFQSAAESDDAHDAVYEPPQSSPLTDSFDGELNNFNPLATETTMENRDVRNEREKTNRKSILTLLNLLRYFVNNDVTMDEIKEKILEEVSNLLGSKEGGTHSL